MFYRLKNELLRKFRLIPAWKTVLKKAYSVKFNILSGICTLWELYVYYNPEFLPRGLMLGLSGIFSLLALFARFYSQQEITDAANAKRQTS